MTVKAQTFRDEMALARWMTAMGFGFGDVEGPFPNSSNSLVVLWVDGTSGFPQSGIPAFGVSGDTSNNGAPNIAEVGSDYTIIAAENKGAVVTPTTTGTLTGPGTVIPNSVEFILLTSGPAVKDNGRGELIVQDGSGTKIGTIDYVARTYTINWRTTDNPVGTLQASYYHSAKSNWTDMPEVVELLSLSIMGGAPGAIAVKIWNDVGRTDLCWSGSVTLDAAGDGYADLLGIVSVALDPTAGKRWVELPGGTAYDVSISWKAAGA